MNFRKFRMLFAAGAVLVLSPAVLAGAAESDTISQNVYIGGVNVSGMTEAEATAAVEEKLGKGTGGAYTVKLGDETLSATAEDFGMEWTNREVVHEAMQVAKGGNPIRKYKEQKDLQVEPKNFDVEYAPKEEAVRSYVVSVAEQYNQEATEGSITMQSGYPEVIGGDDGIAVDVDTSVAFMMDDLLGDSTELEITAEIQKPYRTREMLSKLTDVLGSATTDYSSSTYARSTNIEVATGKISGSLLMPGETYSVTQAVIPFDAENGYYPAPSYESGQVVDTYGGGICQVSTTLYNAVLKSELRVDERHNHTMIVGYVPPSKDAAIAENLMDLVFTNTLDEPVYIYGNAWQGVLNFTIYGHETRDPGRSLSLRSETISESDPSTNIRLVAKSDQNIGYLVETQLPHQGLEAVLWKDITYADGTTETVQVNSSSYSASPAIYEVGVLSPNATAASVIQTAIANNDLATVQAVIAGSYGNTAVAETEAPQSETTQTEAPAAEEPTVDTPAPAVDTPTPTEEAAPEVSVPEENYVPEELPDSQAEIPETLPTDPSGDVDDNIYQDYGEEITFIE